MNTSFAIKAVGAASCGACYFGLTQGALSSVVFLATSIISNQLLSPLEKPLAKWCVKRVKSEKPYENVLIQTPKMQEKMMNEMKDKMEILNIGISVLTAYFANEVLTSFGDAAITFTAKQLSSSGLQALFQATIASHPLVGISVALVTSITLLYVAIQPQLTIFSKNNY